MRKEISFDFPENYEESYVDSFSKENFFQGRRRFANRNQRDVISIPNLIST